MFITGLEDVTSLLLFGFLFWGVTTDGSEVDLEHKEYRHNGEWKMTEGWTCSSSVWSQLGAQDAIHRKWNDEGHREKLSRIPSFLVLGCCVHPRKAVREGQGWGGGQSSFFFPGRRWSPVFKFKFFWFLFLCLIYSFWCLFCHCKKETSKCGSPAYYTCFFARY